MIAVFPPSLVLLLPFPLSPCTSFFPPSTHLLKGAGEVEWTRPCLRKAAALCTQKLQAVQSVGRNSVLGRVQEFQDVCWGRSHRNVPGRSGRGRSPDGGERSKVVHPGTKSQVRERGRQELGHPRTSCRRGSCVLLSTSVAYSACVPRSSPGPRQRDRQCVQLLGLWDGGLQQGYDREMPGSGPDTAAVRTPYHAHLMVCSCWYRMIGLSSKASSAVSWQW